MAKVIRTVFRIDTHSLHECTDGYYLYDYILGMNIAMQTETEQAAYIKALQYYQKSLQQVEHECKDLNDKVQNFILQIDTDND